MSAGRKGETWHDERHFRLHGSPSRPCWRTLSVDTNKGPGPCADGALDRRRRLSPLLPCDQRPEPVCAEILAEVSRRFRRHPSDRRSFARHRCPAVCANRHCPVIQDRDPALAGLCLRLFLPGHTASGPDVPDLLRRRVVSRRTLRHRALVVFPGRLVLHHLCICPQHIGLSGGDPARSGAECIERPMGRRHGAGAAAGGDLLQDHPASGPDRSASSLWQ